MLFKDSEMLIIFNRLHLQQTSNNLNLTTVDRILLYPANPSDICLECEMMMASRIM